MQAREYDHAGFWTIMKDTSIRGNALRTDIILRTLTTPSPFQKVKDHMK